MCAYLQRLERTEVPSIFYAYVHVFYACAHVYMYDKLSYMCAYLQRLERAEVLLIERRSTGASQRVQAVCEHHHHRPVIPRHGHQVLA